jgi:hypothetical protein
MIERIRRAVEQELGINLQLNVEHHQDGTTKISKLCSEKGEVYEVVIPTKAFNEWKNGILIQNAMPELNGEQREFLITRFTPAEQKKYNA